MKNKQNTKRIAGRKGGLETLKRHGKDHFAAIGRKGAKVFHTRYTLQPFGTNDFAIIRRSTGEIVTFLFGNR